MAKIARVLDTASVRIEVDTRRGERDARRAGEDYGRAYAKGADRATQRNPIRPKIDPITADFQRQVRSAVAQVTRSLNADIPLTIRGEEIRARAAVAIAEIERTMSATIPTNPGDMLEYRRKLALLVREASRDVRANIDVDVDRNGIRRAASTFAGLASTGAGLFARLGSTVAGLGSVFAGAFSRISALAGPLTMVLQLVLGVQYVLPGIAAGLSLLAGAGVSALGAISAAGLGLPVLLTSIGAPIAAIALGMDGIKRAAEPLKDEFKLLKDVINVTFELTMRPVFERLQVIFPTLTAGLSETARAVVRLASDFTTVITSEAGIENLRVALAGVSDMIDRSREGLSALFTSLLNVAGTRELYDILGETIGGVAFRFGNMIERVRSSGALTGALTQLRDVLFSVTDMLNVLIEGSITFFQSAGPGLSSFFDSLTEVLSRIDWAALGEAFGGMLERLGAAIRNVPPEQWQALADAIGGLAERFIEIIEDGGLVEFIGILAGLLDELLKLGEGIGSIIEGIQKFHDTINEMDKWINDSILKPFIDVLTELFEFLGIGSPAQKFIDIGLAIIEGLLAGMAAGPTLIFNKVMELGQKALDALANAPTLLVEKGKQLVDGVRQGITDKLEDAKNKAIEIKDKVKDALRDAKEWLKQTGKDLVDGFISGITSKIEDAARKAGEMARRAYDAAKSVLGVSSPSKLFASIGRNTVDGFISGLQEKIGPLIAQIKEIFGRAIATAQTQAGGLDFGLGSLNIGGQIAADVVGSRSSSTVDLSALTAALSEVFNAADWRLDGSDLTLAVNRGNLQLARR